MNQSRNTRSAESTSSQGRVPFLLIKDTHGAIAEASPGLLYQYINKIGQTTHPHPLPGSSLQHRLFLRQRRQAFFALGLRVGVSFLVVWYAAGVVTRNRAR